MKKCLALLSLFFLCGLIASCSTIPSEDGPPPDYEQVDINTIPNAKPTPEKQSSFGNPSSYVVDGERYYVLKTAKGYKKRGIASWYGIKFSKQLTSTREPYDMFAMTAASKVLPLPTFVRVTNLQNGREVIVKVNDRGPFVANRIIDLSYVAAKKLDMLAHGTALVEVDAINPKDNSKLMTKIPTHTYKGRKPQIYLQLGAYTHRNSAENLAAKVKRMSKEPVRIVTAIYNGQHIYKIQVGPIATVAETDELTNRYKSAGIGDAFAVVN